MDKWTISCINAILSLSYASAIYESTLQAMQVAYAAMSIYNYDTALTTETKWILLELHVEQQ